MKTSIGSVLTAAAIATMFKGEGAAGAGQVLGAVKPSTPPVVPPGVAAAEPTTTPAAAAKRNRFAEMFGNIKILPIPKPAKAPTPFANGQEAGSTQHNMAEVLCENCNGIEGANYVGYRIVMRVSADGKRKRLMCIPPQYSKGGPVKYPHLSVLEATDATKTEYAEFLDSCLGKFETWARARKEQGLSLHEGRQAAAGGGAVSRDVDDSNMDYLSN